MEENLKCPPKPAPPPKPAAGNTPSGAAASFFAEHFTWSDTCEAKNGEVLELLRPAVSDTPAP